MTTRILGGKGNRTRRSQKASCRATTSRRPPTRYERSHTRKVNLCIIQVFPNYLLGLWLLSDFFDTPRDTRRPGYRALVLACASVGLVIPLFGGSPVAIMIASQALSPFIMPVMTILLALLLNKKAAMGEYASGKLMNAGLGITVLFTVYMLYTAIIGFSAM